MVMFHITGLMAENPKVSIVIVSLIVSLISTVVTKYTTNQAMLKSIKDRQKEIQKEMKEKKYSPTDKRYMELQSEILGLTGKMFKNSFKPLLITMVPFLLLFYWLRNFFGVELGMGNSWLWYYIIPSIVVGSLYRKIFKIV
jgi:uncharacterized membrane protein (DUF106 family)